MNAGNRLQEAVEQRFAAATSEEDYRELMGELISEVEQRAFKSRDIDEAAVNLATDPEAIDFPTDIDCLEDNSEGADE